MNINLFMEKNECCGCTACANICPKNAIKMVEDEEGFLYPKIDQDLCVKCGLCMQVCAFQKGYSIEQRLSKIEVYASKNKSDEIRMSSSSGGMFWSFATSILNQKGIVYGVIFDKNFHAMHSRADSIEKLKKMQGSKYSQSDLGETFKNVKEDLQLGKKVLFTGTPCQVAGLNKFLGNINRENLILIDIVCYGTPSPKLFGEYIKFLEQKKHSKVKEYYHKSKKNGWRHSREEVVYENKEDDYTSRLSQTWKRIFYTNLALRPSCNNCKYTNANRPSDITIGDFWGIDKYDPNFSDDKGVSVILLNTTKGKQAFNDISNDIFYKARNIEEAINENPRLKRPTETAKEKREKFWNDYKIKGFKYITKKYGGYNIVGKLKNFVKNSLKNLK